MGIQVYVYFKVHGAESQMAKNASKALFDALRLSSANAPDCQLCERLDNTPGMLTLMETYSLPDGTEVKPFLDELSNLTGEVFLQHWPAPESRPARHVEVFQACA